MFISHSDTTIRTSHLSKSWPSRMSLIMEAGRKIELGPLEEFPSRLEEIFQPFSEPEGVITIKARERERE